MNAIDFSKEHDLILLAMDCKNIDLLDRRTGDKVMCFDGHLDYNFSAIFLEDY